MLFWQPAPDNGSHKPSGNVKLSVLYNHRNKPFQERWKGILLQKKDNELKAEGTSRLCFYVCHTEINYTSDDKIHGLVEIDMHYFLQIIYTVSCFTKYCYSHLWFKSNVLLFLKQFSILQA